MAPREVATFVHPPEKHISVDNYELKMALKNRLELDDRAVFDDLCKLMEGVANFDFFDLKQRMRTNFLPFSSGARNSIFLQRSSKSLPTTPLLDKKEDEFIADVYEVLRASHYTLLTREEWDLATSENFNLNLPMKVNWEYMDDSLLKKFWASNPERAAIRAHLPDCMADRILVFHRGIGRERLDGLLIDSKLDLLMDYTVFKVLGMMTRPIKEAFAKWKAGRAKKDEEKGADPLAGLSPAKSMEAAVERPLDAAMGSYEWEGDAMIGSRHRFARSVERKTLARQCPTVLTLLKSFPVKMGLQEPTFKDLVVVYRRKLPERKPPTASANAPNKTKEERLQGILAHRNINIKVFGETPMADVEMIFPEKVVGIKPFQLVNLMITLLTALVTGALVMLRSKGDINMNVVWTAASLVLTRCFTVYNQAQNQRTMLQQQMTSDLYDKMQDSQEGVVSVIMEELSDQQLKQMIMAYMMLIMKDRPLLPSDLDDACEDFLHKEFDHPIDYDLEAALPRLKSWGLVKESSQGKLEALPMLEAKTVLEEAWATAYKQVGQDSEVPTVDMITGAYSVFKQGIDSFQRSRADAAAAAEAEAKRGIMGKATAKARTTLGIPPAKAKLGTSPEPELSQADYVGSPYTPGAGTADMGAPASPDLMREGSCEGSSGGGNAPERKKSLKSMFKGLKSTGSK